MGAHRQRASSMGPVGHREVASGLDYVLDELRDYLVAKGLETRLDEVPKAIADWADQKMSSVNSETTHLSASSELQLTPPDSWDDAEMPEPITYMKLTHHVIRVGLSQSVDLMSTCDSNLIQEGCELLHQTSRLIDLHTKQEDEVFFPFLQSALGDEVIPREAVDDHHGSEHASFRRSLVAKARNGHVDHGTLGQLKALCQDYFNHMEGEENVMRPATIRLKAAGKAIQLHGAQQLIQYDPLELFVHAVPFTTYQLCRTTGYNEGIRAYANALRCAMPKDQFAELSRAILLSAFEANTAYAAMLARDELIMGTKQRVAAMPVIHNTIAPPNGISCDRKAVAHWLESQGKDARDSWTWRDAMISREPSEVEALIRAERLHVKLAEKFAESLSLKHVIIESTDSDEQTIYFFIDNTWEMARRALFAKMYTRLHKERGRRLHVVIIDAKERKALIKREARTMGRADEEPDDVE